jgi:hypothetical protein
MIDAAMIQMKNYRGGGGPAAHIFTGHQPTITLITKHH